MRNSRLICILISRSILYRRVAGFVRADYLLVICLCILSQTGTAQEKILISPLELLTFSQEKREYVSGRLQISQAEAFAFWSIYDRYEAHQRSFFKARTELITEYAAAQESGESERKINHLSKRLFQNDLAYMRTYRQYYKKLKEVLSPRRAFDFIQIEKYFQETLNARLDSAAFSGSDKVFANKNVK
jgi:hypothetical protein